MINGKNYIYTALDECVEVSGETMTYAVRKNGVEVFRGVARQFPDGRPIRFYLNRIAEEYLDTTGWENLLFSTGVTVNPEAGAIFSLDDTEAEEEICSAFVIKGYGTETGITSNPINGKADPRMLLFVSNAGPAKNIMLDIL